MSNFTSGLARKSLLALLILLVLLSLLSLLDAVGRVALAGLVIHRAALSLHRSIIPLRRRGCWSWRTEAVVDLSGRSEVRRRRCELHCCRSGCLRFLKGNASLLLLLLLLLLTRSRTVVLQPADAGALFREVAGEIRLRVPSALAVFCPMTVIAADLAEGTGAGVGPAPKNGGVRVPVGATLVQAWMVPRGCHVVDENRDRCRELLLLLLLPNR